ncbi:hypothetical protein PV10_01577 [Exophiala mesophila]|uniref:Norsolorinic acid ketoreductase n=1 Tax=Exophiala mesophila TaxID=212818 RepID=A0A0D1YB63_EXOME|nr:uncharacterized protein PV10_01577 [Exophiala mesophila]KIV97876.1 hypothetical protein PV10_01577 [Exophiala mesophila]
MASSTNILISGANRGLGKEFVKQYLARPNHIVVGTVRNVKSADALDLLNLPTAEGTKLVLVKIESTSTTDAFEAVKELQAQGIWKLDVVIANAGTVGQQGPMESINPQNVAEVYMVNSVGPTFLFLAVKPLLDKAESPKWMAISSAVASIQDFQKYSFFKMYPYNASKAALNHFTKTIHVDFPDIVAFSVSPGFLETDMGRGAVKAYGLEEPQFEDMTSSVQSLIGMVDNATKEKYSGQFINFNGDVIPW